MDLPYSIVFTCGQTNPPALDAKVVDVTPVQPTAQGVLERLIDAGVTVADLKADALTVFGTDDPLRNLVVYTALVGLAGRRLDAGVEGRIINAEMLDKRVRRAKDAGRPMERAAHVQIGRVGRTDMPEIPIDQLSDPRALSATRHAKRCRLVPAADPLEALRDLIVVSAVRARPKEERFPFLVRGDEPPATMDNAADPVGLDLEQVRRDAVALRRATRADDRSAIVEPAELSERQQRLVAAADVDIHVAMRLVGAVPVPDETDMWVCPRAEDHPSGQTGPTMHTAKGRARCSKCDAERMDPLRLVIEVRGVSPDEAADMLLAAAA